MPLSNDAVRGMLLAGACGDALGAPIEFQSYASIVREHGGPLQDFIPAYGGIMGAVTDDTQMLLWTAEGLIRAAQGERDEPAEYYVRRAYLRWYATQSGDRLPEEVDPADGWLWSVQELHASRAPGTTCLGGLSNSIRTGHVGSFQEPVHTGSGCGAIMRIAPVAVFYEGDEAFEMGVRCGALSHGEPGAVLAGGFYAGFLADVAAGCSFEEAIERNTERLVTYSGHTQILGLVRRAVRLAEQRPRSTEALESLGAAWRGDEALALTLYALLSYPDDLEAAVVFAANHSGDSDSTGSTVGNAMGLRFPDAIPARWLDQVEMREEITQLADDMVAAAAGTVDHSRYPAV
jgi:ADP-ribosyl-[dinitrogen reductase] hydrolase